MRRLRRGEESGGFRGFPGWLVVAVVVLAACGGEPPSILEPVAPDGERIERLWWVMLAVAGAVFLVVMWLLIGAVVRRHREAAIETDDRLGRRLIVWAGLIGPAVILIAVFLLSTADLRAISENSDPSLDVVVSGEQWWWEVTYPASGVVTANEIHLPAGEEIRFLLESRDVIHSFWVPQAGPKRDMIPGRPQELTLSFVEPGTYRGVCAEFCGLQHSRMQLLIVVQPRPQFEEWLATQAEPAAPPSTPEEEMGQALFLGQQCVGCHTIRGVSEAGTEGPDLTHLASRRTIGAVTVELNHENLLAWVDDPDDIKPGVKMPPTQLDRASLSAIVAYLESLE